MEKTYICIDLKSFYASVECVERGLDPLKTNLVVADEERSEKTKAMEDSTAFMITSMLDDTSITGGGAMDRVAMKTGTTNFDEATREGVRITYDEHLYLSGSTLMTQLLPPWLTEKGNEAMLEMLKDNEVIEKVKKEIEDLSTNYVGWDNYSAIAGWDGILITSLNKEENLKYIGKTVGELAREKGVHPVNFIADLLISEETGVGIVTLNIFSEEDTIKLIKHPLQMVGSDSIPAGDPHPRLYGNYPLFIGKYVRDKKALTIEEGIYKSTLLPAKTLGLKDIGEIKEGKNADITIFDLNEIKGYEDYNNKSKSPKGIKYVIVNGKLSMDNELILEKKNGKVIRK